MQIRAVLLVLALIPVAVYFGVQRDPADRARFLRRAGLAIMVLVGVMGTAFIVAETVSDPGGWAAVGYVASWLLPMLALVVLAWRSPPQAVPVFAVLTAMVVAMNVWLVAQPDAWRSFEDGVGPVRAVATFAVVVPLGALGWRRPRPAGAMLVVAGLSPLLAAMSVDLASATRVGGAAVAVVASPALVTGLLFLGAAALDRRRPRPRIDRGHHDQEHAA